MLPCTVLACWACVRAGGGGSVHGAGWVEGEGWEGEGVGMRKLCCVEIIEGKNLMKIFPNFFYFFIRMGGGGGGKGRVVGWEGGGRGG